eukprot:1156026-Pelagomonas_calceolata.AAC.12
MQPGEEQRIRLKYHSNKVSSVELRAALSGHICLEASVADPTCKRPNSLYLDGAGAQKMYAGPNLVPCTHCG